MAFDPDAARRALASQIDAGLSGEFNVTAWPVSNPALPAVQIVSGNPGGSYLGYVSTMGAAGLADIRVQIKIELGNAGDEAAFTLMHDLLAVGTGQTKSIPDLVMADRTLGSAVADAVVLTADYDDEADPLVAYIPVDIIAAKVGAEV